MFKALFYAYVLGGITFLPLLLACFVFITMYTSVPVGEIDAAKENRKKLETGSTDQEAETAADDKEYSSSIETNDIPRTRKGWLTMRRTYEESISDSSYVTYVRSFLDARSKDPKKSRPKDMWYVVLKGKVLFMYEDEEMTECEAAVELSGHQVIIYPEGLLDGELFAKRNAICLRPKLRAPDNVMPTVTKTMKLGEDGSTEQEGVGEEKLDRERQRLEQTAREESLNLSTPWFIFVRSNVEMEDWYFALLHASNHPGKMPTLAPLLSVFQPADMNHLVATLDGQPDVIPMRWLNALIGRIFFSYYRTQHLESYIIGRLMKKLSKVKRPAILTDIVVKEVNVGNKAPMLSKPMLKELTKEGDASLEVHFQYKGEVRITVEATATINLGARFKSYTVKLVLAAVVKELEGNLLIKIKRPPSNRIWYAFTQTPRMVIEVEPIVSDRQITWSMILSTIESKFKEIIQESVVMPNMDDIAFFESSPYEYRGGIWADASRQQRPVPGPSDITEDNRSVASAPPDISSSAPTSTFSEPMPEQSKLDEGLPRHTRSSSQPDIPLVQPPSASSVEETPDLSRTFSQNSTRRRSWFTGVLNEEVSVPTVPELKVEEISQTATPNSDNLRGRALETDKLSSSSFSHAQPNKVGSDISSDADASEQDFLDVQEDKASVHSSRRSASHSASRDSEFSTSITTNKSAPSTPKKSLDSARSTSKTRSPSPPSFFSTLKSRAADKQAISNTAKEAMRKWGVNWGGLKKDATPINDDALDGGSHQRTDSGHKRASYAEVRAAVAERRERGENTSDDSASRGSSPPPLPSKGPSRVVSNPLALLPSGLSAVDGFNTLKSTIAPTLSTKKSTSSFNRVSTVGHTEDATITDEEPKPKPIQLQPQGKTMTIPGIHASHRGDVMSMGYVAPQPTPPSLLDTKLKNPAIQSVYRLWKNPSSSDPDQTLQPESHESTISDMDESVPPLGSPFMLENQVPSQPLAKPTPPPLPPRSIPTGDARPGITAAVPDVLVSSAKNENISVCTTQTALPNSQFTDGDREDGPSDINNTVLSVVDHLHADDPAKHMPPPLPPRKISAHV